MEDIIKMLLDVVRVQHAETEGTDEKPFDMDDVVDMAVNIIGRPDEPEEMDEMVGEIQKLVEELGSDLFPPKTFEEMDEDQRASSVASMIEESLERSRQLYPEQSAKDTDTVQPAPTQGVSVLQAAAAGSVDRDEPETEDISAASEDDEDDSEESGQFDAKEAAELNDLIYKNLMEMMGLNQPQVEYPFDPSDIRYGKEKSITEQMEEEKEEQNRSENKKAPVSATELAQNAIDNRENRGEDGSTVSAWELAQNVIDEDEAAREKEPYVPPVMEAPPTKSAAQLAADAIRKSEEEQKEKLEIEKRAEALMEEAKKRGQDPMQFALHRQEILQYIEKNSDELVSFEDYEDLSPEEKMKIEQALMEEKRANGEEIPSSDFAEAQPDAAAPSSPQAAAKADAAPISPTPKESGSGAGSSQAFSPQNSPEENAGTGQDSAGEDRAGSAVESPVLTEEMLRQLSAEVVRENSEMILSENEEEDMDSINEAVFENIKRMMAGSGTEAPSEDEDVDELLEQAASAAKGEIPSSSDVDVREDSQQAEQPVQRDEDKPETAAAASMNAEPAPGKQSEPAPAAAAEGLSAVELARAAQQAAKEKQQIEREKSEGKSAVELAREAQEQAKQKPGKAESEAAAPEEGAVTENASAAEKEAANLSESPQTTAEAGEAPDPDEIILGGHTRAEVEEALENLDTLGLEGDVYERAKRLLLIELAGSEEALDIWLKNQEEETIPSAGTGKEEEPQDLADMDEDLLERELDEALDEDFFEEEPEEEPEELEEEPEEPEEEPDISDADAEEEEPEEEGSEEESEAEEEAAEKADTDAAEAEKADSKDAATEDAQEEAKTKPEEEPRSAKSSGARKKVFRKKEKREPHASVFDKNTDRGTAGEPEEKEYRVSVQNPFVLKNSASYMDQFEQYILDTQENRKLSTGFKKLDGLLRYGLHKGSYLIDSEPQYLKNSFMQQQADRAAESGVDVLYISTELSRYELMVETLSRLSYEIHEGDTEKAVSVMSIMTGEEGAELASLEDELNWYRGRISEHLYILDQEAVSDYVETVPDAPAGEILAGLIRSIVRDGAHKPVVFIDNIENIFSVEDSEDMLPLMEGIRSLAAELAIPIVMSYGYMQAENETELNAAEKDFHESLGNMCDVYMELCYADMLTEDYGELSKADIREMVEEGETVLIDVQLRRNRRPVKATCQIQGTPKYNYFEE